MPSKPSAGSIFAVALALAGAGLGVVLARGRATWIPQNRLLAPALFSTGGVLALWAIRLRKHRMLHIIGVAHHAQSRKPGADATPAQQAFTRCLNGSIHAVRPAFIAEEDSEEALADRHEASIAKEICDALKIEHRFCDPTQEERQVLDYKDGQQLELETFMTDDQGLSNDEIHLKGRAIEHGRYFPIREQFWLGRLDGCRGHDVIFICGNAHIASFTALLDREGIRHEIVERAIGVTQAEHDDFRRIVDYLGAHPELRNG